MGTKIEARTFALEGKTGLSDRQIQEHRDTLYKGYVNKFNEVEAALPKADTEKANASYSEYRALRVEQTFTHNGVVLHELYFENLGGKGGAATGHVAKLIASEYGSFEQWKKDFRAVGLAARGWAVLAYSFRTGTLHDFLLDTHHNSVPIGVVPLLVLDVYEHAYFIDNGVKRAQYLDTFFNAIDWDSVNRRLETYVDPVLPRLK